MSKRPKKKQVNKSEQAKLDKKGTETLIALLTTDTRTEAAEKLNIARTSLYKRINKYDLEEYLEQVPKEALSVLQQGSRKAAQNFVDKIDSHNEQTSMEASKEVLDRVGVKGEKETNQTNVQVNMGVKFIEHDD